MPVHLVCQSPPHSGKKLVITSDKPVVLKTNKSDKEIGEVRVELRNGTVVLTNQSPMRCTVNEVEQQRSVLHHNDHIAIGKQTFLVVADDDQDAEQTQVLRPVEIEDPLTVVPVTCSACDKLFDDLDRKQGWTSGDRSICKRCLSKGVRPGNLPKAGAEPPAPPAEPVAAAPKRSTDKPSDTDSQRRQRRLSASRIAQVEPTGKQGLLSKVGQVFSGRDERKKLEALEQERRGLLEAAGRLALSDNNGFGLPEHLIAPLIKNATVSMRPSDFSLPALEKWRSLRERLTFLDAEIAALRATLQLGPDPGVKPPREPLRSDQVARQNHTFAMLDGMPTMDLESDPADMADDETAEPEMFRDVPGAKKDTPAKSDRRVSALGRKPHRRRH